MTLQNEVKSSKKTRDFLRLIKLLKKLLFSVTDEIKTNIIIFFGCLLSSKCEIMCISSTVFSSL